MKTNKNMSNEEILQKFVTTNGKLLKQNSISEQDYTRYKNIQANILSRMDNTKDFRLIYISTPSSGYLTVPVTIMDKYPEIQEQISEFSWVANNVWYLNDGTDGDTLFGDALLFLDELNINMSQGLTDKDIKIIFIENHIGLHIMSPHHPEWNMFFNILYFTLKSNKSNKYYDNLSATKMTLERYFPKINSDIFLEYLRYHRCNSDYDVLYLENYPNELEIDVK